MPTVDEVIAALTPRVKANTDAEDSATLLIQGIPAMIQAAVDKATAAGPLTPAQVQAFTDLQTSLQTHADSLAAAVVAGTPAA